MNSADAADPRQKTYSEDMNHHYLERTAIMKSKLLGALERNEFVLHYEAIVEINSGRITGMEALIRWQHPELGLLAPAEFIGFAEHCGLIVPIGAWVLRTACAYNQKLQNSQTGPLTVSVNVTVRQLEDKNLLREIEQALSKSLLKPSNLELEITESIPMLDIEGSKKILDRIKSMGIRLAIDNFGTGLSSLAYIRRFPFDSIKIDRSFIKDIARDPDEVRIIQGIITLAHAMQLKVIAEGVETREQLDILRAHACDEFQGHYKYKSQPAEDFARLLRDNAEPLARAGNPGTA